MIQELCLTCIYDDKFETYKYTISWYFASIELTKPLVTAQSRGVRSSYKFPRCHDTLQLGGKEHHKPEKYSNTTRKYSSIDIRLAFLKNILASIVWYVFRSIKLFQKILAIHGIVFISHDPFRTKTIPRNETYIEFTCPKKKYRAKNAAQFHMKLNISTLYQ